MLKIRQLAFILEHGTLYELIPKDHFLKKIAAVVDFSLANEKFAESYCRVLWSAGEGARVMAEVQVKRLIADATHIEADTRMQRPLAVFRAMAKKITRAMRKHHPNQASAVSDLPETKDLNAQQAGEVLAAHLETVIDQVKHIVPTVKGPLGLPTSSTRRSVQNTRCETDSTTGRKSARALP